MLVTILLIQSTTASEYLIQAKEKIAAANTLTVTVTRLNEEFPKPTKTKWWFQKGGFYRSESPEGTVIGSPEKTWSFRPTGKAYMEFPGTPKSFSLSQATGLGYFRSISEMPPKGEPKSVKWRGRMVVRVEVDGTKSMTKETKLFFFFDPKTRDHVGISANLGSITQITEFSDLKINPKIPPSMFTFVPPRGWIRISGSN